MRIKLVLRVVLVLVLVLVLDAVAPLSISRTTTRTIGVSCIWRPTDALLTLVLRYNDEVSYEVSGLGRAELWIL